MYPQLRAPSKAPILLLLLSLATPRLAFCQGITLSGVGPVNRSMGGAAVAAPLDASGALYWNPSAITALSGTELDVGLELLYPSLRLSSSFRSGTLGNGFPTTGLSGSDRSESGAFPLPQVGLVHVPEESSIAYGLGLFTVGGFTVNYAASTTNPILTAQPPRGFGLGALYTDFQIIQIVPTVAYALTDRLAVGFAPSVNMAKLSDDPAFLAPPDDANGDGFPTYAAGA